MTLAKPHKKGFHAMTKSLLIICDRYLTANGPALRIAGGVERELAHVHGVPHGSVQVMVIVLNDNQPHILLHRRSPRKKIGANQWDVCGGHVEANAEVLGDTGNWNNQAFMARLFADTALREANEEVTLLSHPEFKFLPEHIQGFGGLGVFQAGMDDPSALNREHSACYFAFVPREVLQLNEAADVGDSIAVQDSVGVAEVEEEERSEQVALVTLPELLADFRQNPGDYADGVARVLKVLEQEPASVAELCVLIRGFYS